MLTKINKVNELLKSYGAAAIQQRQIGDRVLFGFKPQYIIDAVNQIFTPENWYYQLHDTEIFTNDDDRSGQVVAQVEIFIRADSDSEYITHGPQFGQATIVYGNVGDSKKGSVTDALGKNFSLFSIGNAAYRGELSNLHTGNTVELSTVPDTQTNNPSPDTAEQQDINKLPNLPNVHYETAEDIILALGDTYNNRSLLKSMGFRWLPQEKAWGLQLAA